LTEEQTNHVVAVGVVAVALNGDLAADVGAAARVLQRPLVKGSLLLLVQLPRPHFAVLLELKTQSLIDLQSDLLAGAPVVWRCAAVEAKMGGAARALHHDLIALLNRNRCRREIEN
jgi:hypothetical protein